MFNVLENLKIQTYLNNQNFDADTNDYLLKLKFNELYTPDEFMAIKNNVDKVAFDTLIANNTEVLTLNSNILYVFNGLYPNKMPDNFNVMSREWQIEFIAADDSIFRKI